MTKATAEGVRSSYSGPQGGHKDLFEKVGGREPLVPDERVLEEDEDDGDVDGEVFDTFGAAERRRPRRVISVGARGVVGVCAVRPLGTCRRQTANARERDRTHSVNTAFGALRTLIPTEPTDRKLSKVETLRLASSYIAHLGNVLRGARGTGFARPCVLRRPGSSAPRAVCTFCLRGQRHGMRDKEWKCESE
uniref:transcription factor 15-like n=1 Tax=Myxine glutinosa TaxID=7769 RepID=UPI00358F9D32